MELLSGIGSAPIDNNIWEVKSMKIRLVSRLTAVLTAGALLLCASPVIAADGGEMKHDPSRDVQTEGVGNPFNFGERNTPENASTAEIRAINHKMTVQEVKYALYKEIDEHWELISKRTGQTEREKVYALFLGVGTRESTLGGNGDGADIETAQSEGFGVSSAHAYGTLQTAVTAFKDADPKFMKEEDVPEMFQYSLAENTFYDAIISDHMGVRKIMHFCVVGMTTDGLEGYQVTRGALKGFNTGWSNFTGEHDGYYKGYPDEIISLARWYYEEGHLYDNVFTWTNDQRVEPYRQGNVWEWWGDVHPSLDEVKPGEPVTQPSTQPTTQPTTAPTTVPTTEPTTQPTTVPKTEPTAEPAAVVYGDVNLDGKVDIVDVVALNKFLLGCSDLKDEAQRNADVDENKSIDGNDGLNILKFALEILGQLPVKK